MKTVSVIILLVWSAAGFGQPEFPPLRPDPVPPFEIPRPGGGALDDGWQYMQTLLDANPGYPHLLNAYPVQIAFTHESRGFLATLHTVFHTSNGGRTWRNLDPSPPPANSPFNVLRLPTYVTGIAARPFARPQMGLDSLLVTSFNANTNVGRVRLLSAAIGNYFLQPDTIVFHRSPHWLTGIALPDSSHAYAFAGYDRKIYVRDSLSSPVMLRWDSLYATTSANWGVSGPVARAGGMMMAVGSEQWVSRDGGATWTAQPAADAQGDQGVSFADSLHGLTGGGRLNPSSGWVHRTVDGGHTWSDRVLETSLPVRCVELVTPEIGFAAGGSINAAAGEIWATTDGGLTWSQDASMNAEITTIESHRASGAYVNVIAAGVFPDFRGGVWRKQLFLPRENSAALVVDPDSLDFGFVARGDTAAMAGNVHNFGTAAGLIYTVESSDSSFRVVDLEGSTQIVPGGDLPLTIAFAPPLNGTASEYTATLTLISADGRTDIFVRGAVPVGAGDVPPPLPRSVSLSVAPNPGNAAFLIRYELARATDNVTLHVYDITGREAARIPQGSRTAGGHSVHWDARALSSGVYVVRLDAGGAQAMAKLLLIR